MDHRFAVAAVAIALSLSASPVLAQNELVRVPGGPGLGIDITRGGSTPEAARAWLDSLKPVTRRTVIGGCLTVLERPVSADDITYAFCKLLQ